jgi:hypothetical protein
MILIYRDQSQYTGARRGNKNRGIRKFRQCIDRQSNKIRDTYVVARDTGVRRWT